MTKLRMLLLFVIVLVVAAVPLARAETGTIRIEPALPLMIESPANFEIWVQGAGDPTNDPHILLVMTEASYNGWLVGDVEVSWTGGSRSFSKTDFTSVDDLSAWVPPSGTTPGARYTVATLKTKLNYPLEEPIEGPIYWANASFLSGPLHTSPKQEFTVTLPSTDPRMLVYALGKTQHSEVSELFNNKVPPTIPGFVVPELGTILLAAASFTALALYVVKRKKQLYI